MAAFVEEVEVLIGQEADRFAIRLRLDRNGGDDIGADGLQFFARFRGAGCEPFIWRLG